MQTQNLANMSQAELIALVQAMAKQGERKMTMKVSEKGALSVYGLGRFPVTLYKSQWTRLLSAAPEVKAFLEANDALLADKA